MGSTFFCPHALQDKGPLKAEDGQQAARAAGSVTPAPARSHLVLPDASCAWSHSNSIFQELVLLHRDQQMQGQQSQLSPHVPPTLLPQHHPAHTHPARAQDRPLTHCGGSLCPRSPQDRGRSRSPS